MIVETPEMTRTSESQCRLSLAGGTLGRAQSRGRGIRKLMRAITMTFPLLSVPLASQALSTESKHHSLEESIAAAELVITGTIGNIDSFVSRTGAVASELTIERAGLLGEGAISSLDAPYILRVFGGVIPHPDNKGSEGRFLLTYIEGAPSFNTGDELILLVKGNGEEALPFVSSPYSILRIDRSRNAVLTEDGFQIQSVSNSGNGFVTAPFIARRADRGRVDLVYSDSEIQPRDEDSLHEQSYLADGAAFAPAMSVASVLGHIAGLRKGVLIEDVLRLDVSPASMFTRR